MKRKLSNTDEQESRLSNILFSKSQNIVENLKPDNATEVDSKCSKPAWFDEDDEQITANTVINIKSTSVYAEKLKQKYELLVGTPNWAKLNKKTKKEDSEDNADTDLLRSVGHLHKQKSLSLKKDYLEIKSLPKLNSTTGNEGPIITTVEFHPKTSVALVSGSSGIVSLFSIGGDVNNKLHSFKLKHWKVTSAQFTPDGSEAYISNRDKHSYCVYNLVKAEPKLIQLPRLVKQPRQFQLSTDGRFIAITEGFDDVFILCAKSKELLRCLKTNASVRWLTFNPDSSKLYCYCAEGQVVIYDLSTFRVVNKFYDQGCVKSSRLAVSPCGKLLATGSGEGIVNMYETESLTTENPFPFKTISNLTTKITCLKFNATSELLGISSGFYPNAMKLVHIPSYHVYMNFPKQVSNLNQIDTFSFSPGSGYMALGNNKGNAFLYRLKHYKNY